MEYLQDFFCWLLVINLSLYLVSAVATMMAKSLIGNLIKKLYGISEMDGLLTVYRFLAAYKLLIIVFIFSPWLALMIMANNS